MHVEDFEDDVKRLIRDYTDETKAALYVAIDNTIFEIWNKANWWYARRPFYFATVAPYTTGTVNVTQILTRASWASGSSSSRERKASSHQSSSTSPTVTNGGSTPKTRPCAPTIFTAPIDTAAVPTATSSTFMPDFRPLNLSDMRR